MLVVVLPSPAGVGVIAETRTRRAGALRSRGRASTRGSTLAICRSQGRQSPGPRPSPAASSSSGRGRALPPASLASGTAREPTAFLARRGMLAARARGGSCMAIHAEARMLVDGRLVPARGGRSYGNGKPATDEGPGGVDDAATPDMLSPLN